jgi:26S proteasome non-ATPase regulatory subunit 9
VDDIILEFGSINAQNFASLTDIGNLVQTSAGSVISVKVKRESVSHKLALIPGPWNGRGLLGCNIIPYDSVDR